ncbi:hypothetical protein B5P45_27695 [Phyllobacterium zundukense]|uniref:Uncharacterized protein n=1 Tax=Phyllobacterium zundukense TaxID=1867719 RepID=A0A2N9VPU2_9HYPH|nr:hypothetical protein [Phyllobacterium zundukense]ATU94916.1 hypothetical protein BLM14_24595 [Phyllobacterium zundukense]PIO41510.1 hypothetical protein B5P45_27695 [Phyllobacterium zundukense]
MLTRSMLVFGQLTAILRSGRNARHAGSATPPADEAGQRFIGCFWPSVRIKLLIAGTACLAHGFVVPIE